MSIGTPSSSTELSGKGRGGQVDRRLLDMGAGIANRRALVTLALDDPAREIPRIPRLWLLRLLSTLI
jgi:hypothetical protein